MSGMYACTLKHMQVEDRLRDQLHEAVLNEGAVLKPEMHARALAHSRSRRVTIDRWYSSVRPRTRILDLGS